MKVCFEYFNSSKLLNDVDELKIKYDDQDVQLIDFLERHSHQRTILDIQDIDSFNRLQEWRKLNAIKAKYPHFNIALMFHPGSTRQVPKEMLDTINKLDNIPYFFEFFVTTWEQLHYLISLKVSDVYLTEDMCFELEAAKALCSAKGVSIRAFPNIAQSSVWDSPAPAKFFIRPEDLDFYSQYIDTIEFWGDPLKQDVFYHIYCVSKRWIGELNVIVADLNATFNNSGILPLFAQTRANCGKQCMRGKRCAICFKLDSLSNTLKDKGISVKVKKKH